MNWFQKRRQRKIEAYENLVAQIIATKAKTILDAHIHTKNAEGKYVLSQTELVGVMSAFGKAILDTYEHVNP